MTRTIVAFGIALMFASVAAAEPVVVTLRESASVSALVVKLETISTLSGGDEKLRATLAELDITDRPKRANSWVIPKRLVELRLKLAGYSDADFQVVGPERLTLTVARDAIPTDRVVTAATQELLRRLGQKPSDVTIELTRPVVLAMPEVSSEDDVSISVEPHSPAVRIGRMQMNATITVNGEKRLVVPVYLNSQPTLVPKAAGPLTPITALKPANELLVIKNQQRVMMNVRVGDLLIAAKGDALQDGKLGQIIRVQNIDSKKVVTGTVTGPGAVDVELGGIRP